jgi:site-specific DNA-methyltransferase (cytosine-N4-specific)
VDLIVTSPPYFGQRSYQDAGEHYDGQVGDEPTPSEFVAALLEVTAECVRVLKPSGSLWVNLGDKYATSVGHGHGVPGTTSLIRSKRLTEQYSITHGKRTGATTDGVRPKSLLGTPWRYALRCIDELGLILRAEVIWAKPNGMPESVTDRVRRSHEQWFHFTLEPQYYSSVDAIRERYTTPPARKQPSKYVGVTKNPTRLTYEQDLEHNPLGKLPDSVWSIPTEPLSLPDDLGVDHFAAFPTEWPKRIIQGWSPAGGVVLDPFGGTGTTALVAKVLGRQGISVDLSADYCRLAEWRVNDRDQLQRALGIPKARRVPAEQIDLFGPDGEAAS